MNMQSPPGGQLADIAIEVETIQALHFQCDVPVQEFRDSRHSRILRKTSAVRWPLWVEREEACHALDSMRGPAIRSWRLGVLARDYRNPP